MDLTRLAQRFLRELHSEPTEVRLIEEINKFLESAGVLETHLKSYVRDDGLLGSKLETLYENNSLDGSRNLKG